MQFTLTTCLAALVALASAYTPADTSQPPSGNPIGHPGLGELIPAGKTYTITWTPDIGDQVTLLLLRGPSTNVVPILTIAETIPNTGSYVWSSVPTDLEPDTTGYGIQLIVEGSGAYQYSPQCGVQNDGYTGSSSSSSSSSSSIITMSSSTSVDGSGYYTSSPPSTYTLISASTASSTTSSMSYVTYTTATSSPAGTGGANFSVPVLTPTNSMSVPAKLQSTGPANNATMTTRAASSTAAVPPVAATGGAAAASNVFVVNAVALALAGGVAGVLAF